MLLICVMIDCSCFGECSEMCLGNDTLIATPNGDKSIYMISVGEQVLVASVGSTSGKIEVNWSTAMVNYSLGTGYGHQPIMVYLYLSGKGDNELICNMDQPFLLADGRYTTAEKLFPGQQLVDKDGDRVTIKLVSLGSYNGGVHHISTNSLWQKSPDGHLLLAGGVVAGDYTLQLHFDQLPDSMKEDNYAAKPSLGTPEYEAAYTSVIKRSGPFFEFVGANSESKDVGRRQMVSGLFKTYCVKTSNLPFEPQALFTPAQATDICKNSSQTPLSNPIPLAKFKTVKDQLSGFYPDIDFYYDVLESKPNVYAFEAYGRKIVQVSGGLARIEGFNYEGLYMAIAHGVACFYGGNPKNSFGYSSVGQADWYAFSVVSRLCWIGEPHLSYVKAAMDQWKFIFDLVSPENAKGNSQDPLNDPSLDCRFQTIQTAAAGGALPKCAGAVVAGDYTLKTQFYQLPDSMKEEE